MKINYICTLPLLVSTGQWELGGHFAYDIIMGKVLSSLYVVHPLKAIFSVVPIIRSAIGNSRLLGNFVTISIGGFQSYNIGLILFKNLVLVIKQNFNTTC